MKILIIVIALFASLELKAQVGATKLEKVYSIALEVKTQDWYNTQEKLWKAEIDKNNKNGEAWLNYYAASRAMRNLSYDEVQLHKSYSEQCQKIVSDAQKAIPQTFEAYFLDFIENQGAGGSPESLLKAAAIRPFDHEIVDELLIHYDLERDQENFDKYAQAMFNMNYMPSAMLNWGYNILSEVDENAILLTCGDNDTYATWIMQGAKGIRKDVTVINAYLIQIEVYRNKLFKELGLPELTLPAPNSQEEQDMNVNKIYEHIFKGNRPVYVATSAYGFFEEKYGKNLYLTGLGYKFSNESFDNESLIRRNYEKRYLLDYLKESFTHHIGDLKGAEFNGMYLPSMVTLYQSYSEGEETSKAAALEAIMMKIAIQNEREQEIMELLSEGQSSQKPLLTAVLDLKVLESNLVKVNEKLLINIYEVSNQDYRSFLQNLKYSGNTEKFIECAPDTTQWTKGVLAHMENGLMADLYFSHPAYSEYPVVNVSFEAAKAYCEWLTKQYNLQRKREYTQVLFRLPTADEWLLAAGSGNAKAINPFEGPNPRNSKGMFLGNIQTSPGNFIDDGGFQTVKTSSYNPNKFGLYCTLGNVAEMTSIKGKALGGSWYNLYEECTFDKTQKYEGPNPFTGFRVVMEIVEK